jgi:hypothetical protein
MPPGPARIEALKEAGKLRNAADVFYGIIFAKRGRPSGRLRIVTSSRPGLEEPPIIAAI